MSGLLFIVGAIAIVVGAVMIGFGIRISEFSFGNTLIIAGTTAAVGGLVVIALGVVVAQLRSMAMILTNRAPNRPIRPVDMFDPPTGSRLAPSQGQIPFPAKPRFDTGIREPHPFEPHMGTSMPADMAGEETAAHSFTPTLRNPDEPPVTVDDEVSLSPHQPMVTPVPADADLGHNAEHVPSRGFNGSGMPERRHEPSPETDWQLAPPPAPPPERRQPQTAYFDAMWPDESKPAKTPASGEVRPNPRPEPFAREPVAAPEAYKPRSESDERAVAILKSGVVDGMGYTLYVDGSIEAELPQGTLRFASINELRSHLEKNA